MIPIATAYLTDIVELRRRVCYWQSEAEGLREQVAALIDRIAIEKRDKEAWFKQLAAAQAENEKLREALGVIATCESGDIQCDDGFSPNYHALHALALPSDTAALQQRLAEERERCAVKCEADAFNIGRNLAAAIRSMK